MKSSYELALERTGGSLQKIDEDKKSKIAEIDAKYKSKIAEAEISGQERLKKAGGNPAETEIIQNDIAVEIASIRSKCEKEKEAVRNGE
jgi:hypothetical protein